MEWLFASLVHAGYWGTAHLFWYNDTELVNNLREIKGALRQDEPIFLYRLGDRLLVPPSGYYWRLMPEHPSLRIYQLEVKVDD